jgi:hypothetical protein
MRRRVDARTPSNPQVAKMNRWGRKQRFDSMGDYCCVCGFHPRETLEEVVLKDVTNPLPII